VCLFNRGRLHSSPPRGCRPFKFSRERRGKKANAGPDDAVFSAQKRRHLHLHVREGGRGTMWGGGYNSVGGGRHITSLSEKDSSREEVRCGRSSIEGVDRYKPKGATVGGEKERSDGPRKKDGMFGTSDHRLQARKNYGISGKELYHLLEREGKLEQHVRSTHKLRPGGRWLFVKKGKGFERGRCAREEERGRLPHQYEKRRSIPRRRPLTKFFAIGPRLRPLGKRGNGRGRKKRMHREKKKEAPDENPGGEGGGSEDVEKDSAKLLQSERRRKGGSTAPSGQEHSSFLYGSFSLRENVRGRRVSTRGKTAR